MESEIYEYIFQPEIYETYLKEHKKRKKKLLVRLVCFRQGLAVTYSGHEHSIFLSYLCPVPYLCQSHHCERLLFSFQGCCILGNIFGLIC